MPFINSNSIFMISGAIISANIKRERAADMGKYEYNFEINGKVTIDPYVR